MAKLTSGNLTLEIRFRELDHNRWIQYEILFLYKGEPMIQDSQLKRTNEHWQQRSPGAFKANEYERDMFIATIEYVLDTDEPDYYVPTDPDVTFAIYPKMIFPFMSSKWQCLWASEEVIQEEEDRELVREFAGGKLATDLFTVMLLVDVYNYEHDFVYCREGPALVLITHRHELRQFANDLRAEYAELCAKYNLQDERY